MCSFRMMRGTLVERCHAESNRKYTPNRVPGTGRQRTEPYCWVGRVAEFLDTLE